MRRWGRRSWPWVMIICVIAALQVFSAKEIDANLLPGAVQIDGGYSKHHSLRLLRHKFNGQMEVACQGRLTEMPQVTVLGEIKDGRVSGIFIIDTFGWVPTSVFEIGLGEFDQAPSKFNTQIFSASHMDRRFARMAWLDGEITLDRIQLTTGFRFLDTSIKNNKGNIALPDDLKIAYCRASNSFHLTPM